MQFNNEHDTVFGIRTKTTLTLCCHCAHFSTLSYCDHSYITGLYKLTTTCNWWNTQLYSSSTCMVITNKKRTSIKEHLSTFWGRRFKPVHRHIACLKNWRLFKVTNPKDWIIWHVDITLCQIRKNKAIWLWICLFFLDFSIMQTTWIYLAEVFLWTFAYTSLLSDNKTLECRGFFLTWPYSAWTSIDCSSRLLLLPLSLASSPLFSSTTEEREILA